MFTTTDDVDVVVWAVIGVVELVEFVLCPADTLTLSLLLLPVIARFSVFVFFSRLKN